MSGNALAALLRLHALVPVSGRGLYKFSGHAATNVEAISLHFEDIGDPAQVQTTLLKAETLKTVYIRLKQDQHSEL